jgi:hypothetical protein
VTYEHACYYRSRIEEKLNDPEALFLGYNDDGMTPQFVEEIEHRFPDPSPWEDLGQLGQVARGVGHLPQSPTLSTELLGRFPADVFVETGTQRGGGLRAAIEAGFRRLVTCDVDPGAAEAARAAGAEFHLGPSPEVLCRLLPLPTRPQMTFWLDAHDDGGRRATPLLAELSAIAERCGGLPTVLIDDLRVIRAGQGWAAGLSIDTLLAHVRRLDPLAEISYADNRLAASDVMVIRGALAGRRGIVTLAGGPTYTLNAYILCRLLRHYGCPLPIEWSYLGAEMRPEWAGFIQDHVPGLRLVDLGAGDCPDFRPDENGTVPLDRAKAKGGWQAKTRSILASSFEEVLYLDADSHPLRDPGYLFDHEMFRRHGAVFWRDLRDPGPGKRRRIRRHFGVELSHWSESGQMLFDKRRCLAGLERADALNHDPESYRVVYGDKDLFPIGFLQAGVDFCWNEWPNPGHSRMMHPQDLDGRKLASHLVHAKWLPNDLQLKPRMRGGAEHYPMLDLAIEFGREIAPLLR